MRILVTGAAGFLGRVACRRLADAGHRVVAVDRRPPAAADAEAVEPHVLDLRDLEPIHAPMRGCDAVVHLANQSGGPMPPQQLYADNVRANAHVFQAAVDLGVGHLVYASSVQVFAGSRYAGQPSERQPSCLPYLPLDGRVPPCPGNAYAASKEAGEALLRYHAARQPDLAAATVRWPLIADAERLAFYRRRAPAEKPLDHGMLDVGFTYLAVEDAAGFLVALLAAPRPGYRSFLPAAEQNRLGWPANRVAERFYPDVEQRQPLGDEPVALVDPTPIREQIGWRPRHSSLFEST